VVACDFSANTFMKAMNTDDLITRLKEKAVDKDDVDAIDEVMRFVKELTEEFKRSSPDAFAELLRDLQNGFRSCCPEKGLTPVESLIEKGTETEKPSIPAPSQGNVSEPTSPTELHSTPKEDDHIGVNSEDIRKESTGEEETKSEDADKPDADSPPIESPPAKTKDGRKKSKGGKPKGSGKCAAGTVANKTVIISLPVGDGCQCILCHAGTMHPVPSGSFLRIEVSPNFQYVRYVTEKCRCNSCMATIAAEVPEVIAKEHIRGASYQAAAFILGSRYRLGMPFLRQETLSRWLENPISDARLWDIARDASELLKPLYDHFMKFVAEAQLQVIDDGHCRIISYSREIKDEIAAALRNSLSEKDIRTGVNTTVMKGVYDKAAIICYISGREHQGERAYDLDQKRTSQDPVQRMTDAASKTKTTRPFPTLDERGFILAAKGNVVIDSRVIPVNCLAHLRNKFADAQKNAPELAQFILEKISAIYDVDDEAFELHLDSAQRLALHQEKSTPLVSAIRDRVAAELDAKTFFPKEAISEAITYAKNNLAKCTQFLELAGCPLDSNDIERAVFSVVRHRVNSQAYQTDSGAKCGDIAMSFFASAIEAKINPLNYVASCLEFSSDLTVHPELWMPWNYEERYQEQRNAKIARREAEIKQGFRVVHRSKKDPNEDEIPLSDGLPQPPPKVSHMRESSLQ
jgi:hypothetical protein